MSTAVRPLARAVHAFRLELTLGIAAYAALLVFANPRLTAELFGLSESAWTLRLFEGGLFAGLVILGCLALSLWGRVFALGQRYRMVGEDRTVTGTLMAEFAMVIPIVLLVMCMIVQLSLIGNASLVVRYAAFAAARSAMVNLESYPWSFQPAPEWVVKDAPERAAQLVLASISPRGGSKTPVGTAMEQLLQAQSGSIWQGRNFADRMEYAAAATTVETLRDKHGAGKGLLESYPRLIQHSEHLIPPYRLSKGEDTFDLTLVPASTISGALIPTSISIPIKLPPLRIKIGRFPPAKVPLQPPFPSSVSVPIPSSLTTPLRNKLDAAIQPVLNYAASGRGSLLDPFADSAANVDFFSPKRVEVTVSYDFLLKLPSLHFVPGLSLPDAPNGEGKAFTINHTVWLQSTGGRRANLTYPLTLLAPFKWALGRLGIDTGSFLYW